MNARTCNAIYGASVVVFVWLFVFGGLPALCRASGAFAFVTVLGVPVLIGCAFLATLERDPRAN